MGGKRDFRADGWACTKDVAAQAVASNKPALACGYVRTWWIVEERGEGDDGGVGGLMRWQKREKTRVPAGDHRRGSGAWEGVEDRRER